MIAFITGSGFYDYPGFTQEKIETPYGEAQILKGKIDDKEAIIIPRHEIHHKNLPHHINYLANIHALKSLGVNAIVSFTVAGITDENIPLRVPIIANELYFPQNQLPDGTPCTFFQTAGLPGRGHLITSSFFQSTLRGNICTVLKDDECLTKGVYGHTNGPRFNSKTEIKALQNYGVQIISQTCGPEIVLANELEIPYALVCFGIDYANGVKKTPTSIEELDNNLEKSKGIFEKVIKGLTKNEVEYDFEGFIYRFQ